MQDSGSPAAKVLLRKRDEHGPQSWQCLVPEADNKLGMVT